MLETLWQDLRFGARMLLKQPGFPLIAVLTLALGIGANTAIFSVISSVLLRPLPYHEPERVITLWQNNTRTDVAHDDISPANFLDWRSQNQVFEHIAALQDESVAFGYPSQQEPERIETWMVSENFFQVLGVQMQAGRAFQADDYQRGNEKVVIAGHALWQSKFGADPNFVGRQLFLDEQPFTVIGVLPPQFKFRNDFQLWTPKLFGERDAQRRGGGWLHAIGRLKAGVTLQQAQAQMNALGAQLAQQYPQTNSGIGITLAPMLDVVVGNTRTALWVLFAAVGLVLLIACANVANLLLVRGAERQREFAIRAALGASRGNLLRQLLTENLTLALLGGLGGVLVAKGTMAALVALNPAGLPRLDEIRLDPLVLVFAVIVSLVTAVVFGLAPAWQSASPDLQTALKDGATTFTGSPARKRWRHSLVVAEIALALVLLSGAGLLLRSFSRLLQVDTGIAADKIVTMLVNVENRYRTPPEQGRYFEEMSARLAALPGIAAVGATSVLPFAVHPIDSVVRIAGRPEPAPGAEPLAHLTWATTGYFQAIGIPLLRGRLFNSFDTAETPPVVVISETLARRFFPNEDPLGQKFVSFVGRERRESEIIGIVGDVRHRGLDNAARPEFYRAQLQAPVEFMTFAVQAQGDPLGIVAAVKNEIWTANKDLAVTNVRTMEEVIGETLATRRFSSLLLAVFALLALLLAGVGIYGVMSYSTRRRTQEIGVRLVLGARPRDILRLVLREGLRLAAFGIGVGFIGALLLTRFMKTLLFGVAPTDPLTFGVVALLLSMVALLACWIPARRAAQVDPMVALRIE